jgi:hypothetical protein
MFEAQLLIVKSSAYKIFSPWFPRQGDNAMFTVETVKQNGSPTLSVKAFTKNSEDTDDGTATTGGPTLTASATAGGRDTDTWSQNLEETVRYEYEISGDAGDWILFRMLPPVWFDDVHQA